MDAHNQDIKTILQGNRIMAVLVIDDIENAIPLARCLVRGGIFVMELALRTEASVESMKLIKENVPEMIAGVGTVLNTAQVHQVAPYADFIVTPGCNPKVIKEANELAIPIAPGIATPSDIETAAELGCRIMKLFPAEPLGGISYLNAINAPYDHLDIKYIPLGGLNIQNSAAYLQHPKILGIGGSWIAPRKLIQQQDWNRIEKNAREAIDTLGNEETL
jgi:2-dehydro-3-deoxyphosphogluconate aldolase/(4S)-4-hydroxy-2-oxoglutarate aldolase